MTKRETYRRLRFSVGSLLIVTSIICVTMGFWSVYVDPYRAQAVSRDKVQSLGGQWHSTPATGSQWHRWLVETMLGAGEFAEIDEVDLRKCQVDNNELGALSGLKWVRVIYLDRAEVTDDNIYVISNLTRLVTLSLAYTQVTDRGIAQLRQLENLDTLTLTGVPISDESIPPFETLASLRELYIRWTKISPAGAREIEETLPTCSVFHHSIQPVR